MAPLTVGGQQGLVLARKNRQGHDPRPMAFERLVGFSLRHGPYLDGLIVRYTGQQLVAGQKRQVVNGRPIFNSLLEALTLGQGPAPDLPLRAGSEQGAVSRHRYGGDATLLPAQGLTLFPSGSDQ
jgi:hypothetical protein